MRFSQSKLVGKQAYGDLLVLKQSLLYRKEGRSFSLDILWILR